MDRRVFLLGSLAALVTACSSSKEAGSPTTATSPATPATPTPSTTTTAAPTTTAPATTAAATTTPTSATLPPAAPPFTWGVASGDPLPDRVVLWTRVDTSGDAEVTWEVATDAQFRSVAARGAATATAADDYTLHVDAAGLQPDTRYWYRFTSGAASVAGRTRTMPAADATPEKLRFGFGSCQDWQGGFYAAHRDAVASDLDLFVWLGDYIYEYGAAAGAPRRHTGDTCLTLADYRTRYALYRSDVDLQAAHAAYPWLVVWDDHEVQNNYAAAVSEDATVSEADFLARRAQAYQAWWEWMPTRLPKPTDATLRIYREVAFGTLARLFLLDGRQYRSDQACGDAVLSTAAPCAEWDDAGRTMLGDEQEAWLLQGLTASTATWNVLGNQVVMGDARLNGAVLNYDQWDGYPVARQRLLDGITASGKRNVVVVTGDIHLSAVADLATTPGAAPVATELVGTSISSGALLPEQLESAINLFPALKYINAHQRGWVRNEITRDGWTAEYRVVTDVRVAGSPVQTDATFTIAPTTPGAVRR